MTTRDHIARGIELDAEIERLHDKLNRQWEWLGKHENHPDAEHNTDVWLTIERKYRKCCDELHEIEMEISQ